MRSMRLRFRVKLQLHVHDPVMLYQVLRILLSFVTIFYSINGENAVSIRKNEKQSNDISLQMCVESFDIHENKIIRTEDSQEMGAKYINEIDLDSRKECLRLCCETDQCDVFVFEEKRPGSCYLFHCGPPDDFKCKFTSHANYTSAVLTTNLNSQNTAELEAQIRRTQQDHELQSLRKLADNAPLEYSVPEPTAPSVTEAPKITISTTGAPTKPVCSRNQFECRTSGDCIAIYNACDGVPQCADGSDEAAELGCPTEKPSISPSIVMQQQQQQQRQESLPAGSGDSLKYHQQTATLQHRKGNYDSVYGREEKDSLGTNWQQPASGHQLIQQQQERIQYNPQQQVVISQPQVNLGSQRYQWEYQPLYEQNKGNFNSINSFRGQNTNTNVNQYEPEQSHIFNHKGPGVIGEDGEGGGNYVDQNRQYAPYYPQDHANWQEGQPQPPSVSPERSHIVPVLPKLQTEVTVQPPPCKPDEKQEEHQQHEREEEKTLKIVDSKETSKSVMEKKPPIAKAKNNKIAETTNTEDRDKAHHNNILETDKPHKHKVFVDNNNENEETTNHHLIMEHLQDTNNEEKDLRPRGAVISLALGLTTTAMMAALIACRLRVVRRRGRRGHGPYAHDADYLVNGMYL